MQVNNKCEKLTAGGMCGYYEERPAICRDYSADNCERNGDGDSFKVMWKGVEEFNVWVSEGCVIPEDD